MKNLFVVWMVALVSHIATAGTPTLEPWKGATATVSFPKGWVVQEQNGVFAAQQDPKQKDAPGMLFVYMPNTNNATEDQLLDTITAQVAKDVKVSERAVIKGGTGHYLIGEGTAEGTKARIAAIAVVANGQAIMCMVVAKTADFNALGGLALAGQVLGTLKPNAAAAAATTTTKAPAPAVGAKLEIGVPSRAVTVADLAGDWAQDNNVVTSYASSASSSGGYSAAATAEKWRIDANGTVYTKMTATSASSHSGAYQVNEKSAAAVSVTADGILTITHKKGEGSSPSYFIRGWGATGDLTVLQLNGPYYNETIDVARLRKDPRWAHNLDGLWVRTNPKR